LNRFINASIRFLIVLSVLVFWGACQSKSPLKTNNKLTATDSVDYYVAQSEKSNLNNGTAVQLLERAYQYNKTAADSVRIKNLLKIAYRAYTLNDSSYFKKTNGEALYFSDKLSDSASAAVSHWNFGDFFAKGEVMDSAYYHYYKANVYFNALRDDYHSGKMLYNMAFIQGRLHNPIESEILTYNAIAKYEPLNKDKSLYECYNHLGLIYLDLNDYDKALEANQKALDYLKKIEKKGVLYEKTLNNIGLVYEQKGEYEKAVNNFKKALENKHLKSDDSYTYALLIDNLAYNQFKSGDTTHVRQQFNSALKIRDSLNYTTGIFNSKLHMAEFYFAYKDTASAIAYTKEALNLATQVNNNGDKLNALKLLSSIDPLKASSYLKTYVNLKDSLLISERALHNKFTRIQFETDTYIKKTDVLTNQRVWIILTSTLLLLILSVLYLAKRQQARKKELAFEQQQQKTNEQIYGLIIEKQTKLAEGQQKERQRIAEELHDGVLGKLFGTRMSLGFLNLTGDAPSLEKFNNGVDEIQKIEKEIRAISHALKNELLTSQSNFLLVIKDLLASQDAIGGFKTVLNCDKLINWPSINENLKINLYRIIQESLQNINKHAKASKVIIDFKLKDKLLVLKIQDDGVGFNVNKTKSGIGLKNIRSRVEKLNGSLSISSTINKGTTLLISNAIS